MLCATVALGGGGSSSNGGEAAGDHNTKANQRKRGAEEREDLDQGEKTRKRRRQEEEQQNQKVAWVRTNMVEWGRGGGGESCSKDLCGYVCGMGCMDYRLPMVGR